MKETNAARDIYENGKLEYHVKKAARRTRYHMLNSKLVERIKYAPMVAGCLR